MRKCGRWCGSPDSLGAFRGRTLRREITREPSQKLLVPELAVLRLQHPVPFVGEHDQSRGHVLPLQRGKEFETLRIGDAKVLLAGDDEGRRLVSAELAR